MADPNLTAAFEANLLAALSTHTEESKSSAPATAPAPAPAPSPAPAPTPTPASIPSQNVAPPQPAQQPSKPQQPPLNHSVQPSQTTPSQAIQPPQQQLSQASSLSHALQQALQSSNPPPYQAPTIHQPQPLSTTAGPVSQSLVQIPPPQPNPQAVPNVPPQASPAPAEPSKRSRSPHPEQDSSHKRPKLEQGDEMDLDIPYDIKAALATALGDFEKQHSQAGNDSSLEHPSGSSSAPQPAAVPLSATATPMPEKGGDKLMKASSNSAYMIRSMSLPVLGNLAVQILLRLSQQPRSETLSLLAGTDAEFRKHYNLLTESFKLARRAFSDSPVLLPDELEINDSEDRETIRVANLATTAISVFGANDVSCKDLDDSFFSIFVPEDGEFKDTLTDLLLSLKTQALLDCLDEQMTLQQVTEQLDKLFPDNFEEWLKQHNLDVVTETDADQLAVKIKERKELLSTVAKNEHFKASLERKYPSDTFPETLCAFLQSHIGVIVEYAEEYGVKIPISEEPIVSAPVQNCNNVPDEHADLAALLQSKIVENSELKDFHTGSVNNEASISADDNFDLSKLIEQSLPDHINEMKDGLLEQNGQGESSGLFDTKDLADFIAAKLNDNLETPVHGLQNVQQNSYEDTIREHHGQVHPQYQNISQLQTAAYHQYPQAAPSNAVMGTTGETLPPNQSCPTSVLYEKARQAAVAKSSSTTRREGLHSTRRPWTPDEEKALMLGLDLVKGPHWSQILSLFGAHGSISDILKDRTQVQLKDKARNLKLFFLKTNSEMPYYLQSVTGELKTRAPGQAARKEAEEKARLNAEDEQARLAGIMTLGGLHNNHHPVANSTIAPSPVRAHTTTPGPGSGHMNGTPMPTPTQAPTNQPPTLAPVPISPMVKTEPVDHSTHQVSNLPQIQPVPAPQSLQPVLKPQSQPQPLHQQQSQQHLQQHPQPNAQHQQQQTQHHPQPLQPLRPQQQPQQLPQSQIRSQTPQTLAPALPQPYHQQHHQQPQGQPQGQQLHQQPHQPPHQPQQQLQQHQQPQPQPQQQYQQPQAQPQPQPQPQQAVPAPVSTPTTTATPTTAAAQANVSVPATEPTPASSTVNNHATLSFGLPPIPPNHHSTPDQAQDVKLFETLQAAIGATSPAHESHPAATVPETSAG